MILRAATALGLFLFVFSIARADENALAMEIVSPDQIKLADGRIVRLAGIKAAPEAQAVLDSEVKNHPLIMQDTAIDRYGRIAATVFVQGQSESLQDRLLRRGLAFVYPAAGDEAHLDDRLAIEHAARLAGGSYWAAHPDISSDDAEKLYGSYGFVTGTVVKAERVKNKVYLNFGPDWRTDFTITIAAHDLRAFKKADLDPLSLQGKKIRVRGWVKRDYGPMIDVTDPHQIEEER